MIPICIEKSPELIIAMIAVLKAGKAFIPVDPISSRARLDYILSSLQPTVILVSEDVYELRPCDSGVKKLIVSPSTVKAKPMRQSLPLPAGIDSAQPAYVLFTSGSTGIPKELGGEFGLNNQTRMLQYTSSTFDPSILEIFATLLHGGAVCIPTEMERLNNIPKVIKDMGVNTAVFVPSVLKLLRPEEIPTVRKLIVGGEKLTQSLIDIWAEQTHVINAYGPTETCICSLANLRVFPRRFGGNIGTSIACRTWVVNPNDECQLMPIGAIGELWIEGPTVARGYLHDLAATKESFASSLPWTEGGGTTRAYRTGDLVRYLPDGELLFLARKDNQVKLNGHRIELEEIEACICRSPLVAGASVQLRNIGDSATLAAFLIPQGTSSQGDDICHLLSWSEDDFHTLLDSMRQQLPTYMVPEYLIPVNFIPRMTSGKVDHHALTAILEQVRLDRHQSGRYDRSEKEQDVSESHRAMKDLWAQALDIPRSSISASDRFLHLGGNSIKAMKLVSAARDSGILLTVGELLKNCTIDELNYSRNGKPASITAARPRSELQTPQRQTYTPTWIQMVSVTTVGGFPEGNYMHLVIELRGRLDPIRLSEACRSLVEKNEILRTQYTLRDGTIEATVLEKVEVPLTKFNSRSEALEHWESAPSVCFDRQLVTFSYVVMDENSTHFALGVQHSQYDAWTVPLLLRQLQGIYHGHPVDPGPPFSEYAARLPRETNARAEMFWQEQLRDLPMTLLSDRSVEGDEPDGHFQKSIKLSPSEFTFATIICSAWALVLSKHATTGRVVFGGAVSGRNMDMEGILDVVGPCINMLPFPIDVTDCATYLEVLQTVRDVRIATVPYEAMPLPDLISRCTNWNPTAIFGSIVQHLDITFDLPLVSEAQPGVDLDKLEWKFLETRKQYGRCRATDIYVFSTISRDGSADVQLKYNPSRISPDLAEVLFSDLCGYIVAALREPEQRIASCL
ncbi:acetyl-CoA synthetase-like protein [Aspergillus parasiticus]|uniref:Acetyl-CoA synthetase-like protein n=1 Tax=Aspergillus parasiticus TaxID=5067 RepID=A0A5N6D6H0_ASPPA|nr:acetyl-CoA synthetase-like protein [Aspergillus parasiticus]